MKQLFSFIYTRVKSQATRTAWMSLWSILWCAHFVSAQGVTTSSIAGIVVHQDGKGVEGASIVAVHAPSGTEYTALSRKQGYYNMVNMRVGGPYTITVTANGETETQKDIYLTLGEEHNVAFVLKEGIGTEDPKALDEVVVTSRASSLINSKRMGSSSLVSNKTISDIATSSRNFTDMTKLDPRANGLSFGGRNPRFNNITVDGSYFNNAFGLASTIGGGADASPISLDAIDQIQINLAPYDVRQGMSTGANINAVTRSGDNIFRGSVYGFYQASGLVGDRVGQFQAPISEFNKYQVGARFGGAIVKNKLFFFVSYEQETRTIPPNQFVATGSTRLGQISAARADSLQNLASFLKANYGYDPGAFELFNLENFSRKVNIRLDYNISKAHKLNVKFNYLGAFVDNMPSGTDGYNRSRTPSLTGLPFQDIVYRNHNDLYSVIAELNSQFSSKVSNNFSVGYTAMRDYRSAPYNTSGKIFPTVDIGNGTAKAMYTSFGYEPFSYNNLTNSDIVQIQDNLSITLGAHVLTAGVAVELNSFQNGFASNFQGQYRFDSLGSFYRSAEGQLGNVDFFQLRYALGADSSAFPVAEVGGNTYSVYVQDEWKVTKNFKLTAGLRLDMFHFPKAPLENPVAATLTFNNGKKYHTSEFPGLTPIFSPRVGFNYDVLGNKKLQVRGGVGLFTGRIPFVWLSNQVSNNGMLFGSLRYEAKSTQVASLVFSPDVNAYRPSGRDTAKGYNLVYTDQNFKFPQVLRANVAVDYNLGKGWVVSAEAMYTKDINAVFFENIALPDPTGRLNSVDNRPVWYAPNATNTGYTPTKKTTLFTQGTKTAPSVSDAILMRNTDLGYSFFATAQIQKQFTNGLSASLSYTYTEAKSVNDGGASIASSSWKYRAISGNPNENMLANASYVQPHRVNAFVSYEVAYAKRLRTLVSIFYSAASSNNFSYTYAGDANGDGQYNDLIYIPRDRSEINLVDIKDKKTNAVLYAADNQWTDLNNYINQDEYLKTHRGKYAERNAVFAPWMHQMDFRLLQEIKFNLKGKNAHRIQITLDIFNFLNLLNPNWGIQPYTNRAGLITFQGFDTKGQAEYTFPYLNDGRKQVLHTTYSDNTGIGSRWSMQLGLRYIFN